MEKAHAIACMTQQQSDLQIYGAVKQNKVTIQNVREVHKTKLKSSKRICTDIIL